MRPAYLLILLTGTIATGYSQIHSIGRLEESLRAASSETIRIDLMNELAREYIYISATTASRYAGEALEKSQAIGYKKGEAYAYRNLASGFSAQEIFLPATEFIEKSIALFEESGDSVGMANCYITLGSTYRRQHDYSNAVAFNKRAVSIFRNVMNEERLGVSLHNLAETEMLNNENRNSSLHIDEAILLTLKLNNLSVLTSCYMVKAKLAFARGDMGQAEKYCQDAMQLTMRLGPYAQKYATTECFIYLGRIASMRKKNLLEEKYLLKAIEHATANQYVQLLDDAYLLLTNHYIKLKKHEAAGRCLLAFKSLNDSISKTQSRDKAAMLKPVLASIKNAARNESLEARQKLQQNLITSQELKLYAYFIAVIFLVVFTAWLLHLYRQRKKILAQLLTQKEIIEEKSLRLEEANYTKDRFFSIVSHDLRSPLNTLHNFILLLEEYSDKLSPDEIKKLTGDMKSNLSNTLKLTDDLITWANSQMEIKSSTCEQVNLQEAIHNVVLLYKEASAQKKIQIVHDWKAQALISADPNQLQFVIRNLVNNAIKFTPVGGTVTISVKDLGAKCILSIGDTGVGIPERMIATLFHPGKWQSAPGTAGEKGTGLGLVLANEFVEKNKGTIQVDSEPGKGTTFRIWFNKISP